MARVSFSSKVPRNWRVWYSGNRVIQICVHDRAIFETGAWDNPPVVDLSVVAGPRFEGGEVFLYDMQTMGNA